jgi:hypothetical protein
LEVEMEWPEDTAAITAIVTAIAAFIVACSAVAGAFGARRRIGKAEEAIRRIEIGRTKALSSAEQLLSAMHRLAAGYRNLAASLRSSATVVPDSVQEIATARQEVERERAVADLYWPDGVVPHVQEVTTIADGVEADANVLEEKANRIERHGCETAKLFKSRYLEPAA